MSRSSNFDKFATRQSEVFSCVVKKNGELTRAPAERARGAILLAADARHTFVANEAWRAAML